MPARMSVHNASDMDCAMQRRWDDHAEGYTPPQGCSRATSGRALEALAAASMRTDQCFVGQCNVITDIKEATFVGQDDAVVACGSDQGRVFLFDSVTGELLRVLWADREVANCVQCHPTLPVLATSGMEDVVRAPQDLFLRLSDQALCCRDCCCRHAASAIQVGLAMSGLHEHGQHGVSGSEQTGLLQISLWATRRLECAWVVGFAPDRSVVNCCTQCTQCHC